MKNSLKIVLIICTLILIAALTYIATKRTDSEVHEDAGKAPHAEETVTSISYNGVSYPIRRNLETLLLIGTDTENMPEYENADEASFYNYIQCDVLVLLVVDNDKKTVTPIQISRDTMCDVPWLDVEGNVGGTVFEQIALAYNSGSGRNDSCEVTSMAVSSLLFNCPINHYLSFAMGGINTLNDLVGGVTVTIEYDGLEKVDPEFIKGATVHLIGEQVEKFVRARFGLNDDTNSSRMARHRTYFDGFIKSARDSCLADSEFTAKAIEKLNPYLITDMSAQTMNSLVTKLSSYSVESVKYCNGELRIGQFYEFYPDENELFKIVKEAYCVE